MAFENPSDEVLRELLCRVRHIAVVGLSPNPARPSHQVAAAMQGCGYRITPVRPATGEVLGEPAYPDLRQVPTPLELVDVFRAPEHVPAIVEACIARGAGALWLQEGVVDAASAARARAAGLTVVMDRCLWKEYCRLGLGRSPAGEA